MMYTEITWLGHSCFKITAKNEENEYSLVIDPYEEGSVPGLKKLDEEADLVLKTHDHFDHNALSEIRLRESGEENPFEITELKSYHDSKKGLLRGRNTIYSIKTEDVHIVHMGDIGCVPSGKILDTIKGCDVLLIPVGGTYTVTAAEAMKLIGLISPKAVIPMHYRNDTFGFSNIQHISEFLELSDSYSDGIGSSVIAEEAEGINVLTPKYEE